MTITQKKEKSRVIYPFKHITFLDDQLIEEQNQLTGEYVA
jgi:hypothetical protein